MGVTCFIASVFSWWVGYVFRWTLNHGSTGPVDQRFDQDEIFLTLLDQFRGSTLHRRTNG